MLSLSFAAMDSNGLMPRQRVGYWFSERKSRKFDLEEFRDECARSGLELVKVCMSPLFHFPFSIVEFPLTDLPITIPD